MDAQIELKNVYTVRVSPSEIMYEGDVVSEVLNWPSLDSQVIDSTQRKVSQTILIVEPLIKTFISGILDLDKFPDLLRGRGVLRGRGAYVILTCKRLKSLRKEIFIAYDIWRTHGGYEFRRTPEIRDEPSQDRMVPILPCFYSNHEVHTIVENLKFISTGLNDNLKGLIKEGRIDKVDIPSWAEYAGYLEHEITIEECENNGSGMTRVKNTRLFKLTNHVWICRYAWGEFCQMLPIPSFTEPHKAPEHGLVISCRLGSDGAHVELAEPVWRNLEDLNNVVRARGKRVVLLMGEPGSGKEVFAHAIHYGSLQKDKTAFHPIALTDSTLDELKNWLFGTKEGPGKIKQSENGTIFLDEFDKVAAAVANAFYGMLLRVLESREYYPVNSTQIEKFSEVQWIFAGSFTARAPKDLPQDLWSRITDMISLRNPMEVQGYATSLFLYWFFFETVKRLPKDNGVAALLVESTDYPTTVAQRLLFALEADPPRPISPLKPNAGILEFARSIAQHVHWERAYPADYLDSVRSVRKATQVAFRILWNHAIQRGKDFDWQKDANVVEDARDAVVEDARDAVVEYARDAAVKVLRLSRGPRR